MTESGPSHDPQPPAVSDAELRETFRRAADLAADHIIEMRSRPVFQPMSGEERRGILSMPFPEEGLSPAAILDAIAEHILPRPFGNGHPRFFGWANSPPAPVGVAAEMLAAAMDPSCAGGDHAAIYLEHAAVRWLLEMVGMDEPGAFGLLTSGGSMANLTGLAAARHQATRADGVDVRRDGLTGAPRYVAYASTQVHSSLQKAMELLGLGRDALRLVDTDGAFRVDTAALREAIRRDRAAGHRPFCVVASAGTVNTGAIDDMGALLEISREQGLWLHVDGAIGAAGALDERLHDRLGPLARVDSLAFDPHKCLSVPVECGAVLVRDGELLRDAFSLVPPYLRTTPGTGIGGPPWFSEYGFQQTRGFRALKLWAALSHMGRKGAAALIRNQHDRAAELAAMVDEAPPLERMAPVELSIVCFRYRPDGAGDAELDSLNRRIVDELQSAGRVFVTGTELDGRFAIRAATLHYGTTAEDLRVLVDEVVAAGWRAANRGAP